MNFRKLITYLTMGTAAAMPLAVAQNPTILQGSYISNVFGQSNFILNPNAQTNIANVTVSNATVTRSTTTPLVATSEFNITTSTATGYADWATRTFDAGMKNQNCEARFTYRGFSVGSTTVQIRQGSNTVAQLTLTASTDPRIASINFPCGDLSAATTLRVQQATAALTGTNELSGLYLGLATNQANVAQAEFIGAFTLGSAVNCNFITTSTSYVAFTSPDADCPTPTVEGNVAAVVGQEKTPQFTVNVQRPGRYQIIANAVLQRNGTVSAPISVVLSDGTEQSAPASQYSSTTSAAGQSVEVQHTFNWTTVGLKTVQFKFATANASNSLVLANDTPSHNFLRADVTRFPTSSELVVTPERQNVWGAVEYRNSQQTLFAGSAEVTGYSSFNNATWNQPTLLKGKAAVTTTNSGNDLGFSIPNLPVGAYKLEISGYVYAQPATNVDDVTVCTFRIAETDSSGTLRTTVAEQVMQGARPTASTNTINAFTSFQGIYINSSVSTRNFRLEASKTVDSNTTNSGSCRADAFAAGNAAANIISFTLTPLDQPSNSALYVEGPVKASATGAAIGSGYVFEQTSSNPGITITNNVAAVQNITSFTLNPGVWMVEANCAFRSNTTTATTTWNFAAAMIADANNSTAGTDDMSYSYAFLGHINVASQYYSIFIKRYINVTSATTYYLNTQNSYGANNPTVACNLKRTRLN